MTPEELATLREEERETQQQYEHQVLICCAAGCLSCGGEAVREALQKAVEDSGKDEDFAIVKSVGCMGLCAAGPLIIVEPAGIMYRGVTPDDAKELIDALGGEPVERLLCDYEAPFFQRQVKIVLENCGKIDPERMEDYVAADGYRGMTKALTAMAPTDVTDEITTSGLRGRGGAGFPTGLKWSTVAKSMSDTGKKYVICNADEGDPGAFMDRSILESDPHRVLEGMAIAAYAVGADEGFIYVRAEYPLAIKRLQTAIRQANRNGLLGAQIAGTRFNFTVNIRLGAGAFVCGEETALMHSIEGKRGAPRPRPPFPAESGLWGCPTLINNVETFSNVPTIVRNGGKWFADIGTTKSKGTKVFALAGQVQNTGLIEVPMGIKLREIIYDIGGGIPGGKAYKAVQTGGPSGGCIPEQYLDMPVDYESLAQAGSIMGSGGMIVMDETSDMVDVARFFIEFCMTESCGKCIPCRVGTAQMYELLTKIVNGEATSADMAMLEELCDLTRHTSLCGLGQTSPNPILSTLRYFRHEYNDKLAESGNGKQQPAAQEVAQ